MNPLLNSKIDTKRAVRLSVASMLLALIAMWSLLAYFLIASRDSAIASEKRILERMAKSQQEQAHHLFSFLSFFLISADQWFVLHPNADPLHDPSFLKIVAAFKEKTNGMIDIRFVSQEGGLFYIGQTGSQPLAHVADRDYFQAQMQPQTRGMFIAKPVLSRVTGLWGLPISYPLQARPNGMAVIFAAIENRALEQPYEAERPHPRGSISLVHRDGTLLFRTPHDNAIGKSVASGRLMSRELPARPNGVFQVEASSVDGLARIAAYESVPDYPLVVSVSSATDDVLANWSRTLRGVLVFGAVLTMLGLLGLRTMRSYLHALDDMGHKLAEQANVDFLTQIPNRRFFMEQGKQEIARARRHKRSLACLMLDLDHFKLVNDRHGHKAGDGVLQAVCAAAQSALRAEDLLGRLGGEEFGVLLPETNLALAVDVAERIRQNIENLTLQSAEGGPIPITISVGAVELEDNAEELSQLLMRADEALYQAKNTGRNRVWAQPQVRMDGSLSSA